ncbi:MAG: hypothetical protein ABJF04_06350 [Reichenbachiella sp.]|uniref:hypothetical protein n=1 Tax=Reichenbachiella sp. TaxID=2184521 RepID=UPI003266A8A9
MDEVSFNRQVKALEKAMKEANQPKETALKTLQHAGIVDKYGKLTDTYRPKTK